MSEVNTTELKRYNGINLPNRKRLEWIAKYEESFFDAATIGAAICMIGMVATIVHGFTMDYSADRSHIEPLLRFFSIGAIIFVPILIAGAIMSLLGTRAKYNKYFTRVYQGKVLKRGTEGGGSSPLRWVVKLEGYTLANELTTSWMEVSAGEWHETAVNDYVEIDLPEDLR